MVPYGLLSTVRGGKNEVNGWSLFMETVVLCTPIRSRTRCECHWAHPAAHPASQENAVRTSTGFFSNKKCVTDGWCIRICLCRRKKRERKRDVVPSVLRPKSRHARWRCVRCVRLPPLPRVCTPVRHRVRCPLPVVPPRVGHIRAAQTTGRRLYQRTLPRRPPCPPRPPRTRTHGNQRSGRRTRARTSSPAR